MGGGLDFFPRLHPPPFRPLPFPLLSPPFLRFRKMATQRASAKKVEVQTDMTHQDEDTFIVPSFTVSLAPQLMHFLILILEMAVGEAGGTQYANDASRSFVVLR